MALSLHRIDCRTLPAAQASAPRLAPDLPEVIVPDEVAALDRVTHASWGSDIAMDDYLRRERVMRATPFARRGLRQWLLRDGKAVLASLETFEFDVTAGNRRGKGHGIASVYVEPERRGKGHASELCLRVVDALKQEGALASHLMSEVGPKLYAQLGYAPRPLFLRRYAAASDSELQAHGKTPPWQFFGEADVPTALAARKLPPPALRVEISADHLLWHMTRGRFYATLGGHKTARHVGARAGEALAFWAPDYRDDVLRILTIYPGARLASPGAVFEPRSAEGEAVRNVLHAGRAVAKELGLSGIEIWENPQNAGYLRGGARSADAHELPMLIGLAPGIRGEDWLDYERAHWI